VRQKQEKWKKILQAWLSKRLSRCLPIEGVHQKVRKKDFAFAQNRFFCGNKRMRELSWKTKCVRFTRLKKCPEIVEFEEKMKKTYIFML